MKRRQTKKELSKALVAAKVTGVENEKARLLGECAALAFLINQTSKNVFFDYSGHVEKLQVRIGDDWSNAPYTWLDHGDNALLRLERLRGWLDEILKTRKLPPIPKGWTVIS